ncbi:hypothetical protein NOC27_2736 [Nitrosococcus oceani AFC27]|uniref:transposase n=1 Tax=Nitrosococcus oceani TaxID=1229 RepID=UPI000183C83A|nr:transposase [Nitrosococcus oceani]EDZ66056.1 hypothetical protein NOC27_2736 [Nitrosococcus oceani AFC27]
MKYKTLHQTVRYRLKAKLKVARLSHLHREEAAGVEFKKTRLRRLDILQLLYGAEDPAVPVRYGCYDETDFGLKTIPRRLITPPGTKPLAPVQWQFKAFFFYGAVEPLSGESFFFHIYLDHLAQRYSHALPIVQLDNAHSHRAKKLELPENIVWLFQPPYSPELNPIKRLWQHMKD